MSSLADNSRRFAPVVLRIGIALVFLWFGYQQITVPGAWTSLIPDWAMSLSGFSAHALVLANGCFEIVFGLLLLLGVFTRFVAFFLALHMFSIMWTVGYTAIGVRDFGLSMAALSVFLYGADSWCFDRR